MIELTLNNNDIIPDEIILICLSFYNVTKYILYITQNLDISPKGLYITSDI